MKTSDAAKNCTKSLIISKKESCLEGTSDCISMVFDFDSYNTSEQYGFSLLPGYGCNIEISRTRNGSYGSMEFEFVDPELLIFDKFQWVESGDSLGMPLSTDGWKPRSVFIVNTGESATEFTATFNEAKSVLQTFTFVATLSYLAFNI